MKGMSVLAALSIFEMFLDTDVKDDIITLTTKIKKMLITELTGSMFYMLRDNKTITVKN